MQLLGKEGDENQLFGILKKKETIMTNSNRMMQE